MHFSQIHSLTINNRFYRWDWSREKTPYQAELEITKADAAIENEMHTAMLIQFSSRGDFRFSRRRSICVKMQVVKPYMLLDSSQKKSSLICYSNIFLKNIQLNHFGYSDTDKYLLGILIVDFTI